MSPKKRYAFVGCGGRSYNFMEPIYREYADSSEIVALCDVSSVRMAERNRRLAKDFGIETLPEYHAVDFEKMVRETRPDTIMVISKDSTHHEFIIKALELGCDVITEKPLTIDTPKANAILEAARKHPERSIRVAFNYRWIPGCTKVKELLASGCIGNLISVNLEYLLNTSHGADYFRRWHSYQAECGGLLVHKSTHHFDLVNWWVDSVPEEVFSFSDLAFYGRENAIRRGDAHLTTYPRYTGHPEAANDPFALDLEKNENLKGLYRQAEDETGYIRDMNVFRDGITTWDSMAVLVRYRSGVKLTYSLDAFSPREGKRVTFNGDRGRLEYTSFGGAHIISGGTEEELAAEQEKDKGEHSIKIYPHFKNPYTVEVPTAKGGHGGGDRLLHEQIFSPKAPEDTWGRSAGVEQGLASIMVGIAANESVLSGQPVKISQRVPFAGDRVQLSALQH